MVSAIAPHRRLAPDRPVGGQVGGGDQAAVGGHFGGNRPCGFARIEILAGGTGDAFQAGRKVRLHQGFPGLIVAAVRLEEDSCAGRPFAKALLPFLQIFCQALADHEAIPGQGDGRRHDRGQGQAAIAAMGLNYPRDRARNPDRGVGKPRLGLVHIARLVQEQITRGGGRCFLAIIQGQGLAAAGVVDHHETAAAQVARPGQGHGKGEAHGDGGINGIASLTQYPNPYIGGAGFLRGDHAVRGEDRMMAVLAGNDGAILSLCLRRCLRLGGTGDENQKQKNEAHQASFRPLKIACPASSQWTSTSTKPAPCNHCSWAKRGDGLSMGSGSGSE